MNKDEYFNISQNKGLTSRCPIVDYCQRRAWTIYFYSDYKEENYSGDMIETLINAGEISNDFKERMVKMSGEVPSILKGPGYGYFSNMCPEVSLFDTDNSMGYFQKKACSEGSWDKEENPKFKILEEKHYSECLEFSKYFFEKRTVKEPKTRKQNSLDCYTYLMIDKRTRYYKIGFSNTPKYREKTLQSEQPSIEMIAHRRFIDRKLAQDFEKQLHQKFDSKRIRGEWFDLNPQDVNDIMKLLTE